MCIQDTDNFKCLSCFHLFGITNYTELNTYEIFSDWNFAPISITDWKNRFLKVKLFNQVNDCIHDSLYVW